MLNDRKLSDWTLPVIGLADKPQMTAAALKAAFDSNSNEIKSALNGVVDDLVSTAGAGEIGTHPIDGVAGVNVQAALAALKGLIDLRETTETADGKLALKADKTTVAKLVESVTFDSETGVFTITEQGGTVRTIDTVIEKVPMSCYLDGEDFVLVLADGTEQRVSLASFLRPSEFDDSATIDFSVAGSHVTASVKSGSITLAMLESSVLTTITGHVSAAQTAAGNAAASAGNASDSAAASAGSAGTASGHASAAQTHAKTAESWARGGTSTRPGENANNAMYYAGQAQSSAGTAAGHVTAASGHAANAANSADAAQTQANRALTEADRAKAEADRAGDIVGGDYVARSEIGTPGGVAGLDGGGKVPSMQLPAMDYVPTSRTVNGKALEADITLTAADIGAIGADKIGAANGVAGLGSGGKVPSAQLPAMDYEPSGAAVAAVAAHDVDENAHAEILGDLAILLPEVVVSTRSGVVVAATLGDISVEATAVGGVAVLALPAYGAWEISATHGVEESDPLPLVVDAVKQYEVVVAFADVVGVCWHYGNASTALERLTRATDPHGLVSVDIEAEPSPAVGTGAGSSPFDDVAPWSGVREYNVIGGVVSYEKGEAGFSRTSNDTVVHIPAYYYRVVDDAASSKRYFYISNKPKEDFALHPGSGRYVGKYNTISGYFSKSGAAPLATIGRPTARTGSRGKGAKWHMYDYATWCAIWLLYLVEFADWDSQAKIGMGYTDGNAAAINTGGCDAMVYHTGRAAGTDGKTAVQYRWIENLWGNVNDWVDGVNFNERLAYICLNPAQYADDTAANYVSSGIVLATNGWIKMLGYSEAFPWAFLPSKNGGTDSSYIPDYVNSNMGWRALRVGGGWSDALTAGLLYAYAGIAASGAGAAIGARLLFVP